MTSNTTTSKTREQWLTEAATVMFDQLLGVEAPAFRVSVGFPKGGRNANKAIGQCHYTASDGIAQLFIHPALTDSTTVLATLLHEVIHAATPGCGHKGAFRKMAVAAGLTGKMTATVASEQLVPVLKQIAEALGEYDHAALDISKMPKQSTRMLKLECDGCGMIIRTTSKWLDESGAPLCGCGGDFRRA